MGRPFFCTRCGSAGLTAVHGRAACGRCGNAFAVPAATTTAYDVWTVALLYLCLPVGLLMLWAHPAWSARRKWTLTGVAVGVIVVPLVVFSAFVAAVQIARTGRP